MGTASQVLAQGAPYSAPNSYRVYADLSGVACSTLHHRARGRQSIEAKGKSQQYLTLSEEKAVVKFVLQMSDFGHPVRVKYIPYIAPVLQYPSSALAREATQASRQELGKGSRGPSSFCAPYTKRLKVSIHNVNKPFE